MRTHVNLELKKEIATLTFSTGEEGKPPTLDFDVLDELEGCLQNIRVNLSACRVVVLQSSSPKYFIVGANIEALQKIDKDSILEWVRRGHEVFNTLEELPVPVAAIVGGYALGGGLELAMACDLIAATERAHFGQPETSLGLVPGWGGSFRLPRRIGTARARELFFTGKVIDAAEAYILGLVNFVGSEDEVNSYISSTCKAIIRNSPIAIDMIKRLSRNSMCSDPQGMAHEEAIASSVCLSSGDTQRRLAEFLQQRTMKTENL